MSFTLEFPVVAPTLTVAIRSPEFGDALRAEHSGILRDTRAGELVGLNVWPILEINTYQFTTLTKAEIDSVRDFFEQTAALEVAIRPDHLGQIWFGYIITPINDIVTQRDNCSYDMGFDFRGVKQ